MKTRFWFAVSLLVAVLSLQALRLHAEENDRARATVANVEVNIHGIDGALLDNVRAALTLLQRADDRRLDQDTIEGLYAESAAQIRRALQPFGFYRPAIETTLTKPPEAGEPWRADYRIDPGAPVTISRLSLTLTGPGASETDLKAALVMDQLREGDVLDHRHYEESKQNVLKAVRDLGYLDANFTVHDVTVDPQSASATIELTVDSGRRYYFGPVHYEALSGFSQEYLDRYRIIEPGTPFRRELLARQRAALSSSGHFREVAVERGNASAGDRPQIPVTIRLTPLKANRYRGRAGWGTETGVGLQFDWTRRYFGSRGHRFNLGATAVQERQRLAADLRYLVPLAPLAGYDLEFGVRHESKDLNFGDVDLQEGGETRIATNLASVFANLPPSDLGDFQLQMSAGLNLASESYDVFEVLFGNLPDDAQQTIAEIIGPEATDTLAPDFHAVIPELRLNLQRADDPLFISRGDYLGLRVFGSHEAVGSNISFWQARLSHWSIWSLGEKNRLLLRTALGYSEAESREVLGVTFNQMPEFYEFRGGGARNIRGYDFETLFPEDGITGGKHQLVTSLEYERQLLPDWSAAVFLDGGNAFNDWGDFEEKLGAGFGVRWRSPFGPARIDIGFPLDEADSDFQVYITVGPEF